MPEPLNVEAFIEAAPWRFAKSMPHIPHEYVVRGKHVAPDAFEAMTAHIRQHGTVEWWRNRYRNYYLVIDGWRYWAMGGNAKLQDELPIGAVTVINRAAVDL